MKELKFEEYISRPTPVQVDPAPKRRKKKEEESWGVVFGLCGMIVGFATMLIFVFGG